MNFTKLTDLPKTKLDYHKDDLERIIDSMGIESTLSLMATVAWEKGEALEDSEMQGNTSKASHDWRLAGMFLDQCETRFRIMRDKGKVL